MKLDLSYKRHYFPTKLTLPTIGHNMLLKLLKLPSLSCLQEGRNFIILHNKIQILLCDEHHINVSILQNSFEMFCQFLDPTCIFY